VLGLGAGALGGAVGTEPENFPVLVAAREAAVHMEAVVAAQVPEALALCP